MSVRSQQPIPPVPDDTDRIARAAFRRGNPYLLLRDRLGAVFADANFADLYPQLDQAAYAPWRLALVTLMQFREGLSDRQSFSSRLYVRSSGETAWMIESGFGPGSIKYLHRVGVSLVRQPGRGGV
jgi:transposase